jgi:hypothetical protein
MSARTTIKPIPEELEEIESALRALTLRVSELRNATSPTQPEGTATPPPRYPSSVLSPVVSPRPSTPSPREIRRSAAGLFEIPTVGDSVRLRIIGTGFVEGIVTELTTHRVKVKVVGYNTPIYRAFHNVTIIRDGGK